MRSLLAFGAVLFAFVPELSAGEPRAPLPDDWAYKPVGLVSYGVYLWHWILINAAVRYGLVPLEGHGPLHYAFHFGVILCVTLGVATVSWISVERPILRATERVKSRRTALRLASFWPTTGWYRNARPSLGLVCRTYPLSSRMRMVVSTVL